jgi:hypothetical protein
VDCLVFTNLLANKGLTDKAQMSPTQGRGRTAAWTAGAHDAV